MSQSVSNLDGQRSSKLYNIGEVLGVLNQSFPELTPSKLRFLEDQGLVSPRRTEAGYRKFSESQIERVRVALELQRDQYLPLKVIKQYFDDLDEGKSPALPSGVPSSTSKLRKNLRYSTAKLLEDSGLTLSSFAEARDVGLIGDEPHSSQQLEIAISLASLAQFGISPRHLRGLKASADREIGIITGVVEPVIRKRNADSNAKATYFAREIDARFGSIRAQLLDFEISKLEK